MKLLLTSQGLSNDAIRTCFLEQLTSTKKPRVCVLYTVKNPGDAIWLQKYVQEANEIGIQYDYVNISEDGDLMVRIKDYDAYYVAGGNTFYILDRLRKTNTDTVILDAIAKGKLYVGLSAGSIIAGPDIEIAGIGPNGDENDIALDNLSGFDLIPFHIYPHYIGEKDVLISYYVTSKKQIISLTDQQAIFVKDNEYALIGEADSVQLGCTIKGEKF